MTNMAIGFLIPHSSSYFSRQLQLTIIPVYLSLLWMWFVTLIYFFFYSSMRILLFTDVKISEYEWWEYQYLLQGIFHPWVYVLPWPMIWNKMIWRLIGDRGEYLQVKFC